MTDSERAERRERHQEHQKLTQESILYRADEGKEDKTDTGRAGRLKRLADGMWEENVLVGILGVLTLAPALFVESEALILASLAVGWFLIAFGIQTQFHKWSEAVDV